MTKQTVSDATALQLPMGSAAFFRALAEDAGNWSGNPWFDGNVAAGKSAAGFVGRLRKAGLIDSGDDGEGHAFAIFTAKGVEAAKTIGVDLSWIDVSHDSAFTRTETKNEGATEMTTTVKGAGRARHESNRRHQQRTPLPPRDGSQNSSPAEVAAKAKARADEVNAVTSAKCPLKGCGKSHRPGSDLGRKHATLAAEEAANGYTPTSVRAHRTRKANAAARSTATAVADAKPAKETAPAKTTGRRGTKATGSAVPADAPGAAKAQRIVDAAVEAGWAASWNVKGQTIVVTTEAEGRSIVTTLTDGKLDLSEMPAYHEGSRTVKLKNVSAVIGQMSGTKPTAKPVSDAPRAPRRTKAERAAEDGPRSLPFDPASASDEEVLAAIRGSALAWMNGISRRVEEAVVAATRDVRNPKYKKGSGNGEPEFITRPSRIEIAPHPKRPTRVVTFTDHDGTGIRSVALDRLTSVK